MCIDNLPVETEEVEAPRYNKLGSGVSVSDGDHGTDDDDDGKLDGEKSRMRVPSSKEEAAALGVRPCLDSGGEFELAMDRHNNHQRRKSLTLMGEDDAWVDDGEGEKPAFLNATLGLDPNAGGLGGPR